MKEQLYQEDFTELPDVAPYGCLFMDLLDITAEEFNHELTREKVHDIYHLCNERGLLGSSNDRHVDGAFVWDHTAILNMASIVLGYKSAKWEYCARVYTKSQELKGKVSYIPNPNYETDAKYLIFQIKTTAVESHFRRMSYDPVKNGSKELYLKSVRYYRRVV